MTIDGSYTETVTVWTGAGMNTGAGTGVGAMICVTLRGLEGDLEYECDLRRFR